ncbi:MAG: PEP-CTERM sorting domain-containing protein [Planctomycetes bacterium]|nr:PEP-CTERM sorting domain-containing protein [Planctomycetota bacterium]
MLKSPCAIRLGLIAVLMSSVACTAARAAVTVIGDVIPTDDLTTEAIEGLPANGNSYNPNDPLNAQTRWEKNEDIIVGEKFPMGGRLDIDGNSVLRYQDLIIGSRGEFNGQTRVGTGTVLITGIGALYSSIPYDASNPPPGLPPGFGVAGSVARATDVGFDVYVGQWGEGRFELRNGGRAEIQDAVVVGDMPGSSGVIVVDGFGALLASGGFESSASDTDPHQMVVGRQGIGSMQISTGALVVSEGPPAAATTTSSIGAVIGSDPFVTGEVPVLGGTGTVTVTGANSRWIVGGSLQVGGFHDSLMGALEDVSGVNVQYNSADGQAGRGTLNVGLGALVSVRAAIAADPDSDDLLLAIGRFGTVEFTGGLMVVGSGTGTDSTPDKVQVRNDGVIKGSGRLETGVFRNRYFGQVRVDSGQSLVIDSSSEFVGSIDAYPLINFGLIEVIGTEEAPAELEFVRPPAATGNPLTPLINRPVATMAVPAPTTFDGGLISAQHAVLRFTSGDTAATEIIGMKNEGVMAFTAGTNTIQGHVVNKKGDDPMALDPKFLIGPDTTVVIEDDFTVDAAVIGPGPVVGGPIFDLGEGATLIVLDQSTLTLAGVLNMDLSLSNPSHIIASGDLGLGGVLNVSLSSDVLASLGHGSSFEILSFSGEAYGIDTTGTVAMPNTTPIATGAAGFQAVSVSPDLALLFPSLDPITQRIGQGIYLSFLDPGMVGGGAMGADFNGDGVVDALDLAIWKANKGITMGASVLQGDANGDGMVDGADYLIWLNMFTGGPGAGGGGIGLPSSSVPEPTALALLSLGGMLAMAVRRKKGDITDIDIRSVVGVACWACHELLGPLKRG